MRSLLVALVLFPSLASAQSEIPNQCAQLYTGQLQRIVQTSQVRIAIETVARDVCSGSDSSINVGFDSRTQAVVEAVPVASQFLGSLGITNTQQMCEAYRTGRFSLSNDERFMSEPVVAAMEQANRCIEIANRKHLIIQHDLLDPSSISFAGHFTRAEAQVRFTVQATGGFTCEAAKPGSSSVDKIGSQEVSRNRDFTIACRRAGNQLTDGSLDYPDGAVSINFGEAIYSVKVPADTVYGATSRIEADAAIGAARQAAAEADHLASELRRNYEQRVYTPHLYYFGEHDQGGLWAALAGGVGGVRFPCEHWSHQSAEYTTQIAKNRLCPTGSVKNVTRIFSRGGNRCGYNHFVMICETQQ